MADKKNSDKTKVFISYARRDIVAVERLRLDLQAKGFDAYLDKHDILPGEPWQARLGSLIANADSIIFCLGPHSVASTMCDWEINEAERLNKRILPVMIEPVDDNLVPGRLKRLNYIFLQNQAEYAQELAKLTSALNTDIDWVREHTRLGELASRWKQSSNALRGKDLIAAEQWITTHPRDAPEPTSLHREYISHSRKAATRRQRAWLGGSLVGTLIFAGIAVFAYFQMRDANTNLKQALITDSKFRAEQANRARITGDGTTAMLLALEGLPDKKAIDRLKQSRPFVPEAEFALNNAKDANLEQMLLLGHTNWLKSIIYSPDGTHLLTTSADKTARLWDAASGKQLSVLKSVKGVLLDADFSPDGSHLVTAHENKTARIWDTARGKQMTILKGHTNFVLSAKFSPDGSHIVTASNDKTARLWDAASGKNIAVLKGHEKAVLSAIFSPDGKQVLSFSRDKTARIWDSTSGKQLAALNGHKKSVLSAAFSPDSRRIVTSSADKTARVWDAKNGTMLTVFKGHGSFVLSAVFSPDGKRIATISGDKTARVWNATNGKQLAAFKGHTSFLLNLTFSPNSQHILTASDDGTVRVWDATSGTEIAVLKGHARAITNAIFSTDGKKIATSSKDATARIWILAKQPDVQLLKTRKANMVSGLFSPDGMRIVTKSWDKTVRIWNAKNRNCSL